MEKGCCDNMFSSHLKQVLSWENPRNTGMIFTLGNLFFITMAISEMNLITIFSYMFLFYVISGITIAQFSEKSEKIEDEEYEHISKDTVEHLLKFFYAIMTHLDSFLRRVTTFTDFSSTIQFYGALYTFTMISGWVSDASLIWIIMNILFLWKPVYNCKKDLFDGIYHQVRQTMCGVISKVDSFIPKYKEHDLKKE